MLEESPEANIGATRHVKYLQPAVAAAGEIRTVNNIRKLQLRLANSLIASLAPRCGFSKKLILSSRAALLALRPEIAWRATS